MPIPSTNEKIRALITPNRGGGLSVLALYPRNQIGMKQHVTGDALRAVDAWARSSYKSLGGRLPEREPEKAPEHAVSLKDAEQASRSAAEALAGNKSVDAPARAEQTI